ncbi:hypothetical protein F5H01DRAFT_358744 [Linnemannia elongata]|nr:hypothetical protein F5H01DRAFT_358744 [Linnemannia elongata]
MISILLSIANTAARYLLSKLNEEKRVVPSSYYCMHNRSLFLFFVLYSLFCCVLTVPHPPSYQQGTEINKKKRRISVLVNNIFLHSCLFRFFSFPFFSFYSSST